MYLYFVLNKIIGCILLRWRWHRWRQQPIPKEEGRGVLTVQYSQYNFKFVHIRVFNFACPVHGSTTTKSLLFLYGACVVGISRRHLRAIRMKCSSRRAIEFEQPTRANADNKLSTYHKHTYVVSAPVQAHPKRFGKTLRIHRDLQHLFKHIYVY